MVPGEGLEPSIPCGPRILSPVRIPVPPPRLLWRPRRESNPCIAVLQTAALQLRHVASSPYYNFSVSYLKPRHLGRGLFYLRLRLFFFLFRFGRRRLFQSLDRQTQSVFLRLNGNDFKFFFLALFQHRGR